MEQQNQVKGLWACPGTGCNFIAKSWPDYNAHVCDPQHPVNAPKHYTVGGIDNIEFIRAKMSPEMLEGFYMGNVIKYLVRYRHKDGLNDLKKAQVYIGWLVDLVGKQCK